MHLQKLRHVCRAFVVTAALSLSAAAEQCVTVDNDVIRSLVADNDHYVMASIAGGMYKDTKSAVTTFAVGATVLSSTRVSAETI